MPLAAPAANGVTGLPIPRFVSLKSDRVNVRKGPGTKFGIAWVFNRAGLPVEVIDEVDVWRQVRDSEGAKGWVLQGLLSGRRTALVLPWEAGPSGTDGAGTAGLHEAASASSGVVALMEAGTIVGILSCDKSWCHVSADSVRGYIEQKKLCGVYADEAVE